MKQPRGSAHEIKTVDGTFQCYHVAPVSQPAKGGIVLLQEVFGTNQHIRELADQWADAGYDVLVPDLFWRVEPNVQLDYDGADLDRAREIYGKLDWGQAEDDVKLCADHLRKAHSDRVFGLGFCFGGKLVTRCATKGWLDKAVGYYGVGIEKLGVAQDVVCPIMLHFGADDSGTPPEAIAELAQQLPDHAKVFSYEGAGHGFNNWRKSAFNAPQSQCAFARSLNFLSS